MGKVLIILAIFFLCHPTMAGAQDDPMKGPWKGLNSKDIYEQPATRPENAAAFLVKFFKKHIGAIDGSDCPMHPSCSRYSIECFEKHGFFIGWTMTWDRLYRCGRDELKLSPWIIFNGKWKSYDPVKSNDFWWNNEE